jgi:hypothetical protein
MPSFNSKPVVVSSFALKAFMQMMNSKDYPFSFDLAVGFMNKYIYNENADDSSINRILHGYSSKASVCTSAKYLLVSDFGGFSNIIVHK